ncbi:MAG: YciI family protein [Pseudomonadota bacterium]
MQRQKLPITLALCLALGFAGTATIGNAQESDIAKLAASLQNFKVWLIETRPAKPEQFGDYIMAHLEYQFELEREGVLFAAGPLLETEKVPPPLTPGLIAVRADSLEQAQQIADADPMHSSGTRTYTIRTWVINEGAINVTVNLSGQNPTKLK